VPRKPRSVGRGQGAQYEMILTLPGSPACLSRPNGMAEELQNPRINMTP